MTELVFFVDISTLFEFNYTGVPNVNYRIVKYLFDKKYQDNTYFFHCERTVKRTVIAELLEERTGKNLLALHNSQEMYDSYIDSVLKSRNCTSIGIFSNIKTIKNKFSYEAQVIHDLTFLLTPELHHQDTINWHTSTIEEDIDTDDLCICVSESTREDLVNYLQFPPEKTLVSHLGFDRSSIENPIYSSVLSKYSVEKFVLVIGTIEPRKNIQLIFKFLESNPHVLEQYKFVFLGRDGWGKTFKQILAQVKLKPQIKRNKIKHFGYVTEEEKIMLLMTAEFLIYSSVYEGFGLPVLEALSCGCPVLTSMTSSIPEVGGNAVKYFEPYDLTGFENSFFKLTSDLEQSREKIVTEGLAQAGKFTWDAFMEKAVARIKSDVENKN